eukprot:3880804-Pyramimonas_sp.AAC.1
MIALVRKRPTHEFVALLLEGVDEATGNSIHELVGFPWTLKFSTEEIAGTRKLRMMSDVALMSSIWRRSRCAGFTRVKAMALKTIGVGLSELRVDGLGGASATLACSHLDDLESIIETSGSGPSGVKSALDDISDLAGDEKKDK